MCTAPPDNYITYQVDRLGLKMVRTRLNQAIMRLAIRPTDIALVNWLLF